MNHSTVTLKRFVFSLIILILTTACGLFNVVSGVAMVSRSQSVDLNGATSVQINVELAFGELKISGGTEKLMDASFNYNVPDWNPEVKYEQGGPSGILSVIQPPINGLPGKVTNQWDLRLNNRVPLELNLRTGAAVSELNLAGLSLSRVQIQAGEGKTVIDLSGNWSQDVNVEIKSGAGEVTMVLPSSVGVQVESSVGLGQVNVDGLHQEGNVYQNDTYGKSDYTMTIKVENGVGDVNMQVE